MRYLAALLLLASSARAGEWSLIDMQVVKVDYQNYSDTNRYPDQRIIPNSGLDLGLSWRMIKYGFVDATVHSLTEQGQFREVGLEYRAGLRMGILDLYYGHESLHYLDSDRGRYPLVNSVGATLYLYRKGE